ncbi:major facilitator superfamily domain-containing protein [Mycotypha africana]|uniref:major facilitator superfamily domain-containing protein n=1 Tax=Mycotypha africana TaxID=64632 RepID=UPI0023011423|nr:major facilitator superfamily domain-containing protein [Mycotypha africana]KAI8968444.1 major facilitator superfamily domain-containing protein [Mycotypha africana]
MSGFASTIYFPGLPYINSELKTQAIATTLTAALYVLFMGFTPIVWASLSEALEIRRSLLITSMIVFGFSSLGAALVNNIWGLLVLRIIQAMGASAGLSIGGADCFPVEERGAAFGKFYFMSFIGPLIGPILGGFLIVSPITWRATFLFTFAFGLFIALAIFTLCPETYRDNKKWDLQLPVISQNMFPRAQTVVEETHQVDTCSSFISRTGSANGSSDKDNNLINTSTLIADKEDDKTHQSPPLQTQENGKAPLPKRMNPFAGMALLKHSFVLLAALTSGLSFGCMLAVEVLLPDLYEKNYGFNSWQTGLSYMGGGVGNVIGSALQSYLSDKLLLRARRRRGGAAVVEDRLSVNLWPASIVIILGTLVWGWSIELKLNYWVPIVAFGIQTFGMNQIMAATSAYIVDAVPGSGASATAAANLLRMVLACILTIAAEPLEAAVGPGWTCVLMAGLGFLGLICLIIIKIWGKKLRANSGYPDIDFIQTEK